MKAKMEFDMENPDDIMSHLRATHANEMALFIWNLKHNTLRKIIKEDMSFMDAMDLIEEKLNELPFDIEEIIR